MINATANFKSALASFRSGKILYVVTIAGYSKVFTNFASGVAGQVPWLESIDDSSTTINELDGGSDQITMAFYVMDRNGGVTADFPSFTFEGKQVSVKVGLPGLAQTDFVTVFTGFIEKVDSANKNADYYFTCSDVPSSVLSQTVYPLGDDGQLIGSGHSKTLLAHPLDLMVSILGQAGLNLVPDFDGNVGGLWTNVAGLVYSATGGVISGGKWVYTGTGAASAFVFNRSATFNVVPGQQYTLSAYIDSTNVTSIAGGGAPFVGIYDPTIATGYITIGQGIGLNGQVSVNWTCPAGVTQVKCIFDTNNCTVSNGNPLTFSNPQLSPQTVGTALYMDLPKIRAYRDGIYSGIQFQFNLTQSVVALDFVKQQILKPLGGYLWVNSLGQVTVNFFSPLSAPVAVATLGPNAWNDVPEAEQLDIVNVVQYQFDKDDFTGNSTGNYMAVDTEQYGTSINKYGSQFGELVIQADGLRSGLQGFFIARMVARMVFGRYGLKNLKFDQNAPDSAWSTMLLEPGDIVAVTHSQVPDRAAGVMGVTNKLFEVVNRSFKFSVGNMNLTLIDASFLSTFGLFQIASDAQADYTAGSNVFMYLCNGTDQYTNGDPAHVLG